MSKKTLAARLKWARSQKGLSQKALALLVGVTPGSIGHLESGLRKAPRNIATIAHRLGVDVMWLAEGTGSPTLHGLGKGQIRRPAMSPLSAKEITLIVAYRKAGTQGRKSIASAIRAAANEEACID
jgi:transcriptional regulator with XRE-family HTH domain